VDAALISRVAINTDTGFAAYDNADPAIVGDLNSNASVDSSDVTIMNRYLAGFPSAQIPLIPFGPVESAAAAGAMESIQPSGNVVTANSAGTGSSASLIPVASSESSGLPSSPIREVIVEMAGAGLELNAATSNFLSQSGVGGLLPTLQYSQAPSVAPDTGTAASLWDDLASSIVKTAPREGTLELGEMLEESIEWEAIDQIFAGEWREA
jgi:hypothetical protein